MTYWVVIYSHETYGSSPLCDLIRISELGQVTATALKADLS
jgi:hypothetical protein